MATITQIAIMLIAVLACHKMGITAMVIAFACINILWLLAWQLFASRLIGYRFVTMLRDLLPFMLIALAVMAVTYLVTQGVSNMYILLVIRILLAATLYLITMKLLRARILEECIEFIRSKKSNHQNNNRKNNER